MSSPMPDLSDLDWAIVNLQATIEAHVETLVSAAREEERAKADHARRCLTHALTFLREFEHGPGVAARINIENALADLGEGQ